MKLSKNDGLKFIKDYQCILLIGTISEISRYLEHIKEVFNRLFNDVFYTVVDSPRLMLPELLSNSLLFGRNVFIIENVNDMSCDTVCKICNFPNIANNYIIFLGNDLRKNTNLAVKFREKSDFLFIDTSSTLKDKIIDEVKKNNLQCSKWFIDLLLNHVTDDDMYIKTELANLSLYLDGKQMDCDDAIKKYFNITINDFDVNKMCNFFLKKNFKQYLFQVNKINSDSAFMLLIRALLNNLNDLMIAKQHQNNGIKDIKVITKKLNNKFYLYNADLLQEYLNLWHYCEIKNIFKKALHIELQFKLSNDDVKIKFLLIDLIPINLLPIKDWDDQSSINNSDFTAHG